MRYLIYSTLLICSLSSIGQTSNLVFFTEEGEKFTLYVNGAKINDAPDIRVKATGVSGDFAQAKIVFETPGAPELKKGIMLEPGKEMSAVVKKNKKGKYVFRPVGSADIQEEEKSETVRITQTAPPAQQQTTTITTTTTTETKEDGSLVDLKVTKDGGFSMKVNQDKFFASNSDEPASTTTTQTASSSSYPGGQQLSARVEGSKILLSDGRVFTYKYVNSNRIGPVVEMKQPAGAQIAISYDGVEAYSSEVPFVYQENDWKKSKVYFKLSVNEPAGSWSVKLKHNSSKMIIDGAPSQQVTTTTPAPTQPAASTGCSSEMATGDFNRAKESIEGKAFADEKMTVFKQIIRSNCLSVNQVKGMMALFTYEEEKLDVAKLSYPKTVDQGNYYQVNDALTFSDSVEELEAFLAKQ
ncbi:MAG: DUF4476 domain-containing protein [Bacteroidota bacterium]